MGILYIILVIFGVFGGAFGVHKLDLIEAEGKKHKVLRDAVIADINNASKGAQVDLKSHLSRYYKSYEITPELIEYFDHNYLETVKIESQKLEKQRALEEQQDKELDRTLNALEDRQKTQLETFQTVKGQLLNTSNSSRRNS